MATQDSELATLRDELYYHRKYVRSSIGSKDSGANRTDPSQYPSQEAPTEDAPSEPSTATSSQTSQKDDTMPVELNLHIVLASTATHTHLRVAEQMTIQNLKNKLVSRLLGLGAGDYSVNFETHALYHKGVELSDSAQTLQHYGVKNDAALVLLEKVLPNDNAAAADVEVTNIVESINSTSIVESKLCNQVEELTSIALKSQEELVQAARTLQFQVSTQESSKEVFVEEIGAILKSLVMEAIAEHTEKHAQENHKPNNNTSENVEHYLSDIASPLSKLNMGELVETDGDCDEDNVEDSIEDVEDSIEEPELAPKIEGKIDSDKIIPLKVDTSAEVLDAKPSPFNPPLEVEFEVANEDANEDMEENKTEASLSTMHYSASSTQLAFSSDSVEDPSLAKADLDLVPAENVLPMSPANNISTTAASAQEFRFSEYEFSPANEDQIAEVNAGEYNTIDIDSISDTALEIAPAQRSATLDSLDASLVSIEVSHSEFITTFAEMEAPKGGKKKKGRFSSLKKMKKLSVKSFVGRSKK